MALSTQGSVAGNPNSGLINKIATGLGLPGNPQPQSPGLLQSHTPTAPVKKMVDSQGNQVHFDTANAVAQEGGGTYKPNVGGIGGMSTGAPKPKTNTGILGNTNKTGSSSTQTSIPAPTPVPVPEPAPVPITAPTTTPTVSKNPIENAQTALNAGEFTPFEKQAITDIGAAKGMANYGTLAQNAEAGAYQGINPNSVEGANQLRGLMNRPDLAGRAAGSANLYGGLGNIFGSASQAELTSAEAQAGRAAGQANTVLTAGLPKSQGYVNLNPFNPDTTGGGLGGAIGAAASGAEIESGAASVGKYTTQNTDIQNSIDKLDNIAIGNNSSGGLIANMGTVGFNPTSTPIGNQTYSYYFKNLNPGAQAGIQAGLGDIANNVSTVLSSVTGLTPTAVSSIVDSYDFQDLTPKQLNDFLLYVKGYANNSIKGNSDTINRIKSGEKVSATNAPLPAPDPNSLGIAALGTGASLGQGLVNKILSSAGNIVAGAAAGGVAGLATKVLGVVI